MLCKTRGIVLHAIPYNDKYSIIYMYTEAFGRTSYLVARSRGKKSAVYAPFGFRDGGGASE
jgi:DNA repair protein RecO (recombination protein O)